MPNRSLLRVLAKAILAGPGDTEDIVFRCEHALGGPWRWIRPLARRYAEEFAGGVRPRHREVVFFLLHDHGFRRACVRYAASLRVEHWLSGDAVMQPVQPAENWGVPVITTVGDLAAWLGIGASELDWFADLKALAYKTDAQKLSHYHYRALAKDSGSIRLIEAPKTRLKELQRHILVKILEKIPPHPAVHGFVKVRSIKTFVAPHLGRRVVLRMDLRDFFPSIAGARVQAVFRTIGYPEAVADLLGGICTNVVPRKTWKAADLHGQEIWEVTQLYANPHLPQGAPSSPLLANICAYRMDCRLSGLARTMGAQYTRYADDLAFSGDDEFAQSVQHFATYAAAIAIEEGFFVHHRKTRIMRQGVRQHLAGLVANQHLNVIRTDFDRLKATLYNCVRFGPEEHNRAGHPDFRSHLDGRVSFVEMINPEKGQRLRRLFRAIEW